MWNAVVEGIGDWRLEIDRGASNLRSLISSLLFLLAPLLIVGCSSVAPVVKVGLAAPFEGRYRDVGYDAIYSARLAVREVNRAGGIGGYRVALVALDDGGDPQLAQDVARSLVIDRDVIVVLGHWRPDTTAVAAPIYAAAGLPLLPLGEPPLTTAVPNTLPSDFLAAYEAVTPFDETAGPHAGATYDGMGLVWQAMGTAVQQKGTITRESMAAALRDLRYEGMTGVVFVPGE